MLKKLEIKKVVKSDENFTISHIAPNTQSRVNLLVLNDANINIDVTIDKKAAASNCHLDIKVIDDTSKVTIKPNFTVKNSSSTATHQILTITFANESVFYANTRGISEQQLKKTATSSLIKDYES